MMFMECWAPPPEQGGTSRAESLCPIKYILIIPGIKRSDADHRVVLDEAKANAEGLADHRGPAILAQWHLPVSYLFYHTYRILWTSVGTAAPFWSFVLRPMSKPNHRRETATQNRLVWIKATPELADLHFAQCGPYAFEICDTSNQDYLLQMWRVHSEDGPRLVWEMDGYSLDGAKARAEHLAAQRLPEIVA